MHQERFIFQGIEGLVFRFDPGNSGEGGRCFLGREDHGRRNIHQLLQQLGTDAADMMLDQIVILIGGGTHNRIVHQTGLQVKDGALQGGKPLGNSGVGHKITAGNTECGRDMVQRHIG
ncbi:MAG TPA: hypothetical protein DCY86_07280 [Bdellovibrionales bacterium]|nr:hypothetical protein [Bdellovibrionales bacterium]